ncbi:hypothetical protein BPTFM16_02556 [Altererythrobacter insulae]|nr:hypothetical protein BPTFM16_02556 [Altererythrobacter insulae]
MAARPRASRGWIFFFWAAAIFNFAVGAAGMFAPTPDVDARLVGVLVFGFGIVYAMTARDPERYAGVLWAGVFSKIGIVALLIASGDGSDGGLMSAILALDLLFAFGFLLYLLTRVELSTPAGTDQP